MYVAKTHTKQMIRDVRAADRRVAEEAIAKGVQESQERGIEAGLIAEALIAELIKIARTSCSEPQIAGYLRTISAHLGFEHNMHLDRHAG